MSLDPHFKEGQTLRITTTFTDAGKLQEPNSVHISVERPDGTVVPLTASRVSEAVWRAETTLRPSGTWWYKSQGLNEIGQVAYEDFGPFEVEAEPF